MLLRRSLAARIVTRADEHSEAAADHVLGDLETDPLVCSGDESDGLVMHGNLVDVTDRGPADTVPDP